MIKISEFLEKSGIIKLIKFLAVGGTVFIVITFFVWLFNVKIGMGNYASLTIAYVIGSVIHFSLNNFFTFNKSKTSYKKRISGYIFVLCANYGITALVGNYVLNISNNNVMITSIAVTLCTTVFSFLFLDKIAYK